MKGDIQLICITVILDDAQHILNLYFQTMHEKQHTMKIVLVNMFVHDTNQSSFRDSKALLFTICANHMPNSINLLNKSAKIQMLTQNKD